MPPFFDLAVYAAFSLRILSALWLLSGAVWFGAIGKAPSIVFALASVSTVACGLGKWRAWVSFWKKDRSGLPFLGMCFEFMRGQVSVFAAQGLLNGCLYLIGRGVGSLSGKVGTGGGAGGTQSFLGYASIGLGSGLLIVFIEGCTGAPGGILPAKVDSDRESAAVDDALSSSSSGESASDYPMYTARQSNRAAKARSVK